MKARHNSPRKNHVVDFLEIVAALVVAVLPHFSSTETTALKALVPVAAIASVASHHDGHGSQIVWVYVSLFVDLITIILEVLIFAHRPPAPAESPESLAQADTWPLLLTVALLTLMELRNLYRWNAIESETDASDAQLDEGQHTRPNARVVLRPPQFRT